MLRKETHANAVGGCMEKRIRMWFKACLIIAGLLFFCFLAGRQGRGTDYEKEARIRQYEEDESVEKIGATVLAYGEMIRQANQPEGISSGESAADDDTMVLTTLGTFTYQTKEVEDCLYRQITAYVRDGSILEVVADERQQETLLSNVWISGVEDTRILCFMSGALFYLPYETGSDNREQVADILLQDGKVTECLVKKEKVSGKLIGVTKETVRLPDGDLPLADEVRVYRLYGEFAELSLQDLPIGYENTDFVMEEGRVCACLINSEENMETIRVLLQSGNYDGCYHKEVSFTADCDYTLEYGGQKEEHGAGEPVHVTEDSDYFSESDRIFVSLSANTGRMEITSIQRNRERTDYRGSLEIVKTQDGLAVINELLLEEYLYGVVPSEMPASYPEESLKAQAVCARTYAYGNMKNAGFPNLGAHVDDSTSFQVYGNTQERAETTAAVGATRGQLLYYGEELVSAYYYSTSCGYGTDTGAWLGLDAPGTPYLQAREIAAGAEAEAASAERDLGPEALTEEEAFERFIQSEQPEAYEKEEAWYRWHYTVEEVDIKEMERRLAQRYDVQPGFILTKTQEDSFESRPVGEIGSLRELRIVARNPGGNAAQLLIEGSRGSYLVETEYNIRYVLNNGSAPVIRKDGSETAAPTLLPSAFLMVTTGKEGEDVIGYTIIGGGYGHGIGMSQNGAKHMAMAGLGQEEILAFFYQGSRIETIY